MKTAHLLATSSLLLLLGTTTKVEAVQRFMGSPQNIGDGTIHVWGDLTDDLSQPLSIGVTFTADALNNLPAESDPAPPGVWKGQLLDGIGNYTFEWELLFPREVLNLTPFSHMGFNWNPHGHGPTGIYDSQHFDVHFYMLPPEERHLITGLEPNIAISPLQGFLPPQFFGPPQAAEPRMGQHWIDPSSPELQPPPNNEPFTHTWIYGTNQGEVIFWEPMVTRDFFLSNPNNTYSISQPLYYAKAGYYPTTYNITSSNTNNTYSVSLSNFIFREATTVPEPNMIIGLLLVGSFGLTSGLISRKK